MVVQTRIERRQRQAKMKKQKVLSLMGTGLVITPVASAFIPQANADQYQLTATASNSFLDQIADPARQIAAANDLYASVMIAQAMLESGHGSSSLSNAPNYNLFGVKAYSGEPAVFLSTQEYIDNEWVTMNEPFRVYESYYQSLQDHANLLRAYYQGAWQSTTGSYQEATAYLTGRYATDPAYAQKLNELIQTYNLTQYDNPAADVTAENMNYEADQKSEAATTSSHNSQSATTSTYIVRSGDTLWDIAQRYGTSLDSLMTNNNLTSDLITEGQQLAI